MPNPYDEIFESDGENQDKTTLNQSELVEGENIDFKTDGKEPLDEIVDNIQVFSEKAEAFAKLLSQTKAIDNKESSSIERFLFEHDQPKDIRNLNEERAYHKMLRRKFEIIIVPMRDLAKTHLAVVQQYNKDIDQDYFSVDKSDQVVKTEKSMVTNNINIQRKILGDAANDLSILKNALEECENRINNFINAGGHNNISTAEYEIIVQKRMTLTKGKDHQFDFSVFSINIIDKTAISFGLYMQETSSQYFGKLIQAFEMI